MDKKTLDSLLRFEKETGKFFWISGRRAGLEAGSNWDGYVGINIGGKNYRAHRLVFLHMTGEMPKFCVDHINGVRSDNRPENLRDVETYVNIRNQKNAHKNNKSGFLGVEKRKYSYRATIRIKRGGKSVYLGSFKTAEEASATYWKARLEYYGI
jgi:hypothetical protein